MSITIKLWNFTKRHNSTARPSGTGSTSYNVVFKAPTSINNPVFIIDTGGTFPDFNYLEWDSKNLYYYIEDIVIQHNNLFELHCKIDVLATAKPYIMASSAFVKYSSSNFDPYLKDDRIVATSELSTEVGVTTLNEISTGFGTATSQWILTTFSDLDGLCSYAVNMNNIMYLSQKLTQDGTSIWGSIEQLFGDAKGSIVDLKMIPFTQSALQSANVIADNSSPIHLGDYDTGQNGFMVDQYLFEFSDVVSFTMPDDFRRCSPYTDAKLFLPLIGTVDISLDEFTTGNIGFHYVVNISNGNVSVQIQNGGGASSANGRQIATYNGNCALSMPLAFQQINGLNAVAAAASAAAGIASGGALTVAGIAGSVAGMTSAFKHSTSVTNSFSGNFAGAGGNKVRVMLFKHGVSEEPANMATLYGRPCNKVLSLSSLTGYCQTSQFSLMAPLDDGMVQAVNAAMDSGVYLE